MSISVAARKAKGRVLQQWVAEKISKLLGIPWGKDELISSRPMGQAGTDVCLIGKAKKMFPYSVEIKRQETISLPSWIKQAKDNQLKGTNWLLIYKRSREKPVVIIDAEVFFKLQTKLMKLKEKLERGKS